MRVEDEESIKSSRGHRKRLVSLQNRVCVQNSGCGPGGERANPLLAAPQPIRFQSTNFSAAEFSKSPHCRRARPFPFLCSSGTTLPPPNGIPSTTHLPKDSRRHRPSRCLRRMFDSFDETGITHTVMPAATSPLPPPGTRSLYCRLSSSSPAGKAFALGVPRHQV
jgi:hypothetical protein